MDAFSEDGKEKANLWSRRIIGAAIEVHRTLGPGLLEAAYERCLCREFDLQGIPFERQRPIDINTRAWLSRAHSASICWWTTWSWLS
jgi:GxxExxY protein